MSKEISREFREYDVKSDGCIVEIPESIGKLNRDAFIVCIPKTSGTTDKPQESLVSLTAVEHTVPVDNFFKKLPKMGLTGYWLKRRWDEAMRTGLADGLPVKRLPSCRFYKDYLDENNKYSEDIAYLKSIGVWK
jgi:hypothetical protein